MTSKGFPFGADSDLALLSQLEIYISASQRNVTLSVPVRSPRGRFQRSECFNVLCIKVSEELS